MADKYKMSAEDRKRSPRVKYLIYPRFQLTLIALNAGLFVLAGVGVIFQVERSFYYLGQLGPLTGLPPEHPFYAFTNHQQHQIRLALWSAFAIAFALSSFLTLLVSHKLAGPVVRMKGYFGQLGQPSQGEPKKLSFRKGDFFNELPPIINSALQRTGALPKD